MLYRSLFTHLIRVGTLRIVDAGGRTRIFGDGGRPQCTLRLHDRWLEYKLPINPSLHFAEAYMDGRITIEDGSLEDFLAMTLGNYGHLRDHWLFKTFAVLAREGSWVKHHNPIGRAQRNVAHHYDLSGALYDLFLDRDRQYSCGYFTRAHGDLERAQEDKKRHLAAKLLLGRAGLKVLDIGSGWGGLGLYLAEASNCDVTGVTLSVEQHKVSQDRARSAGLDQRVRFDLRDYREDQGRYDRIVSVGMFEHVGRRNYGEFFAKVYRLLAEHGVCLLHSIGSFGPPQGSNPFIRKYIFPGGQVPALSEVLAAIERSGLLVTDIEILRLHYAETLKLWHQRFQANRAKVAELYDERFCRMWELWLKSSETSFRHNDLMVFQLQLAKRLDAVPLTRDYIYEWEHARRGRRAHAAE